MTLTLDPALRVDGTGCVGLWIQGLIGDVILASTYFDEILRRHPDKNWILVHSYRDEARVHVVRDVLAPYFDSGRIREYVYHFLPSCLPMPSEVDRFFARSGVAEVFEFMFDKLDRARLSSPRLELDLDKLRRRKAVVMRRSAWNAHFPERNRPYREWRQIEAALLGYGYETFVVGVEDEMPVTEGVIDRRHSMSVRQVLDFTTDASLVVSCTTFLPVFTQFVCPTLVICDRLDYENQITNWRVTSRYHVHPSGDGLIRDVLSAIALNPRPAAQGRT